MSPYSGKLGLDPLVKRDLEGPAILEDLPVLLPALSVDTGREPHAPSAAVQAARPHFHEVAGLGRGRGGRGRPRVQAPQFFEYLPEQRHDLSVLAHVRFAPS